MFACGVLVFAYGVFVVFMWFARGVLMVFLWSACVIPKVHMVCLRCSSILPVVFLWCACDVPLLCVCGIFVVFLLGSCGFLMVWLRCACVVPAIPYSHTLFLQYIYSGHLSTGCKHWSLDLGTLPVYLQSNV